MKNKVIGIISAIIWIFFYFQNIYMSLNYLKNINRIINLIHSKLNSVKILLDNFKILFDKCENINCNSLYKLNNNSVIKKYNNYYKIFNNDCFNNSPSLFSAKGTILSTFQIFDKNKKFIKDILNYIGIIDYLNSNNLLINKYNDNNKYCFTKYSIKLINLFEIYKIWNPYIDEKPVLNDVNINKNIILTGPNAAGKSTFIKSVAINIILSQTIGISSSDSLLLTPF